MFYDLRLAKSLYDKVLSKRVKLNVHYASPLPDGLKSMKYSMSMEKIQIYTDLYNARPPDKLISNAISEVDSEQFPSYSPRATNTERLLLPGIGPSPESLPRNCIVPEEKNMDENPIKMNYTLNRSIRKGSRGPGLSARSMISNVTPSEKDNMDMRLKNQMLVALALSEIEGVAGQARQHRQHRQAISRLGLPV